MLVEKVKTNKGKRVEVYGVEKLTANSLINAASEYVPITEELLLN